MPLDKATAEVKNAAKDIKNEKNEKEKLISGTTGSQALLMMMKREERFNKSKSFNGFVLEQRSSDDNEFFDFLFLLKQNVRNLPPGTRIELAVVTRFVGPRDDKEYYDTGFLWQRHWSAVDLYIDENANVNSFVLDAANSIGYKGMHARLKTNFPEGNHYVYKCDNFIVNQQKKQRSIQTQSQGCSVFVTDHVKQLSQIDPVTLYQSELPGLVNKMSNAVKLKNFEGHQTKLIRIFRGMQSWSGLNSLGPELLNSPIKEKDGKVITLGDYARSQTIHGINLTISNKSERYKSKKSDYFETLSPGMRIQIMLQRQGFTFIKNPSLFELCTGMAHSKKEDLINFITAFSQALEDNSCHFSSLPIKKIIANIFKLGRVDNCSPLPTYRALCAVSRDLDSKTKSVFSTNIALDTAHKARYVVFEMNCQQPLKDLNKTKLDHELNYGKFKNEILLSIASLFNYLDDKNRIKSKFILNAIIKNSLPILQQDKVQILDPVYFDSNLYLQINQNAEQLLDSDGRILACSQYTISPQNALQEFDALDVDDINLAAHLGNLEVIQTCLKHGADVTQIGSDGWTPLMRAASAGRLDILKTLYEHHPELHKIDIEHMSKAAYLAAKHGHLEVLDYLLKMGINPNSAATENSETKPLIIAAAEKKLFSVIELLLTYGVNLALTDGNGNTLFHVAVNAGDINLIKYLIGQNLNPNVRSDNGCTPIYLAALQHPCEERKALIQTLFSSKQIDVNDRDENSLTQFELAAKKGDLSVLLVLLESGVDLPDISAPKILHECISQALLTAKQHKHEIGKGIFLLYKAGILNDCFAKAVIESTEYADSFAKGLVALHEKGILTDTIFQGLQKHMEYALSICMSLCSLHKYHMLNDKNQKVVFTSSAEANIFVNYILSVLKRHNILNDKNFQVSMSSSEPDFSRILIRLHQLNILNDETRQALVDNSQFGINILNILARTKDNMLNQVNFMIIASNAVKIDISSYKLLRERMLNDVNFRALLNDPDNAEEIASNLVFRENKTQKINILLNTYKQFQNMTFFSNHEFTKEINTLSDLKMEIARISPDDLPEMINNFKTQEKYKVVFEGKFKDQIQELLDELITQSPSTTI